MQFKSLPGGNGGNAGKYIRLKDGESIKGTFQGNPEIYWAKWENGRSIVVPEGTPESKPRFKINLIVRENGALVAKIWENSMTVYRMLKDIHEEFDLSKSVVKISRAGTGTDTVYTVMPTRDVLDSKALKAIQAVGLHDLKTKPEAPHAVADQEMDFEDLVV